MAKHHPYATTIQGCLQGLADPLTATRYHSLVIEKETCPPVFRNYRLGRGRHHYGRSSPRLSAYSGRAVSSRECPDPVGQSTPKEFFDDPRLAAVSVPYVAIHYLSSHHYLSITIYSW